jgi:hypothetical protein
MAEDKNEKQNLILEQIDHTFSTLWQDETPSDFSRFVPYVVAILQIVAIAILILKK